MRFQNQGIAACDMATVDVQGRIGKQREWELRRLKDKIYRVEDFLVWKKIKEQRRVIDFDKISRKICGSVL